jgi:hypothetical protein
MVTIVSAVGPLYRAWFLILPAQAQHVLHVIKLPAGCSRSQAPRQAPRAKASAGRGAVSDFQALAVSGKQRRMVADDIAAAHRGKADRPGRAAAP